MLHVLNDVAVKNIIRSKINGDLFKYNGDF
jgi:hypothetical protein